MKQNVCESGEKASKAKTKNVERKNWKKTLKKKGKRKVRAACMLVLCRVVCVCCLSVC